MVQWKNDEEMFSLMKEKLYTPVVGDILDQMGYRHQFSHPATCISGADELLCQG